MNFGNSVKIKYAKTSNQYKMDCREQWLHNVTEIRYRYPSPQSTLRVSFESDIHKTGLTVFLDEIEEFETILATEIAPEF
ncbi:MAG: hypothetical protein WC346_03295 [Methanogenium sp.]|jgi:hypothetical protein